MKKIAQGTKSVAYNERILIGSNNKQTSRAMYEETNRLVEELSETIYFAATKLALPSFLLPKVFASYLIYFTTNAGNDAFDLPISMW